MSKGLRFSMINGSTGYLYLLSDQVFAPFWALPERISEAAWGRMILHNDPSGLWSEPRADEAVFLNLAPGSALGEEDEECLQTLMESIVRQSSQASLEIDLPKMLGHLLYNGIKTVEPMPEHLEASWAVFQALFRREPGLPAWIEKACPESRVYLGLLKPDALRSLRSHLLEQGLLAWLIVQLEQQEESMLAQELHKIADFLTFLPEIPCWLLALEPSS